MDRTRNSAVTCRSKSTFPTHSFLLLNESGLQIVQATIRYTKASQFPILVLLQRPCATGMVQYYILEGTICRLFNNLQPTERLTPCSVFSAELVPFDSGRKRDKLRKLFRGREHWENVSLTVKIGTVAQSARAQDDGTLAWNEAFPL